MKRGSGRSLPFSAGRLLTHRLFSTGCFVAAHLSPLASQTPATSVFQGLRDSLSATSDTTALRALLRASRADGEMRRADASAAIRSGVLALRLSELGVDPDFGDALASFRHATRREPGRPEAWHGLALAERGRSQWEMKDALNLGSRVGLKALERSANSYRRAVAADATYVPAALALAQVELALLDTTRLALARDALRRAAEALTPDPPELLLALGRVERACGSLDSAGLVFERYLLIGPKRALGLLELARTRLASGRSDGEAPYYEGASIDDPEAIAGYRADLQLVAPDSVLRGFDQLSGRARAAHLHRFWTDRDRLEMRGEGERLREHYRRLHYARRHFPLTISRRFYGALDAYRSGSIEMDDRGVIYVRHGEPAQRLRPFVFGAMPNESWRYAQAEGDLLLHFSSGWDRNGGGDLYDYRLVQSVLDLRGTADVPRDQLLLSRQSLSPAYARMLNWGRYGAAHARALERNIGIASIAAATTTDTYELQFARRLDVIANLIAVGGRNGRSLGHLVFGVAASAILPGLELDGVSYPVRVRVVVLDAAERAVAVLDTMLQIRRPQAIRPGEYLVGRAEVLLPPGDWAYRASLQAGEGAGVVLRRDSVRVAPSDGWTLSLSDVALGTRGRAVRWITDAGDTVLLAPSATLRTGLDVELYYEVAGAAAGERYRHEITVLRPERQGSDRRRPLVALSFEEDAPGPVIRSHRMVRLDRLKEGSYVVEVRVTSLTGEVQTRRRPIRLIK